MTIAFHDFVLYNPKHGLMELSMASVSELVEDVAAVMNEPIETVRAYARALIDAGELPKSHGRAVAQVRIADIVKLVLAVSIAPKIKDVSEEVRKYFHMKHPGVSSAFPASRQGEAGTEICDLVAAVLSDDDENRDLRLQCMHATISLTLNWPEIEIRIRDGLIRFKDGGHPDHWEAHYRRQVTIHGSAFLHLGIGKGRDYGALVGKAKVA